MNRILATCTGAVLLAAAVSCVPAEWETYRNSLPPEQRAYMTKVDELGPSARVDPKNAEAAWKRAEEFLTRFAGGVEKVPNQPSRIRSKGGSYAYEVSQRKDITDEEFSVSCSHSSRGVSEEAWRNARIAQYYIATGELPYPELVTR
jgi:hypothetical protein